MHTDKYQFGQQSSMIRLGNLIDDMHEVHKYFHLWQSVNVHKAGLPYANYQAMSAHLTEMKKTTHPHRKCLPSQAIQCELKRIDTAYQRFLNKLGGRPHIKLKHKLRSITFPSLDGLKIGNNRITITFRECVTDKSKWKFKRVTYSFHKHRDWKGEIKRITLKRDKFGDYWKPCITTDAIASEILPTTGKIVGLLTVGMNDAFFDGEHRREDTMSTIS